MKIRTILTSLVWMLVLAALAPTRSAFAQSPKGATDALVGSWTGPISAGGNTLTFVVRLSVDDKGQLQGSLAVPEQGAQLLPMSEVKFADNKLNFKIAAPVNGEFTSTLASGTLSGLWRQGDPPGPPEGVPVVLKKGEYVAQVHVLKLDTESFGKLVGTWTGDLHPPGPQGEMTLPVVLRFETNPHGDMVAFMDSPSQGAHGIEVSEVTLAAGKVAIKIPAVGGEFDANLSGSTMAGQLSGASGSFPLTLTRK